MNYIAAVLLLLAAAVLGGIIAQFAWFVPFLLVLVLVLTGLILLFGTEERAKVLAVQWGKSLTGWFKSKNGWPLWEAIAVGIIVFGIFAGPVFLDRPLIILGAFLAPWLAGLWAGRRGTGQPVLMSIIAGIVVGVAEGVYFLDWLAQSWTEVHKFPAWLLVVVVTGLSGGVLGFWAFARGKFKLTAG